MNHKGKRDELETVEYSRRFKRDREVRFVARRLTRVVAAVHKGMGQHGPARKRADALRRWGRDATWASATPSQADLASARPVTRDGGDGLVKRGGSGPSVWPRRSRLPPECCGVGALDR